jgi:sugar O-acyltransferase (sialic acid O-acetyltransferase NeuD family)
MGDVGILIISAGKLGREVHGWVQQAIRAGAPWRFKGFLDDRRDALSGFGYDAAICGGVDDYRPLPSDGFLCAVGEPRAKKRYCEAILRKNGRFVNLIHPTAIVGDHVRMGQGVILAPFVALTSDLSIGSFVTISSFTGIAHDTRIGDYCQLSGHCGVNGNAVLEEGVFLGSHAAILPSARVGAWSYVGAGSVVLKRVPPLTKVFGNPAMPIGTTQAPG